MDDLYRIASVLADDLVAARPTLDRAAIRPDSSLTGDLGFDSLGLVELARRLSHRYDAVDLLPWIAQAMSSGDDRVASLAAHLLVRLP